MTQDEIIELARQAGCGPTLLNHWPFQLEAFAKLIAEKEREACAKIIENILLSEGADEYEVILRGAEEIRARGQA